jgi:O-antigen/teichoic acid export membrane protein
MLLPSRLFSGTVISTFGRVIGTIISIATVGIMTRALIGMLGMDDGVRAYGVYAAALAYLAIVTIFADGGLYLIFTREASRAGADEQKILEASWLLRLVAIGATVLVAIVLALILPYQHAIRVGVLIGVWGIGFQLASQLFLGVFQKKLKLLAPAIAEVSGRIVQLLGVVIFAYFQRGIYYFLVAFVLGTIVTFYINLRGAKKLLNFSLLPRPDWVLLKKLFLEALPMGLSLVLSVIFFKVDSVMLSFMKPAEDLAYYALAYKVLESLLFFPAMIGGLLLPIFSQASSEKATGVVPHLKSSFDLYLFGGLPLAVTLWVLAPSIVRILGGTAFSPAVPALRVLSLALAVLFLGNLFGSTIVAIGKQKLLVYLYGFLVIVNIVLNSLFIPRYSFMGAAWVTLITELLSSILAIGILAKFGVWGIGTKRTPQILLAFIALIVFQFLSWPDYLRVFGGLIAYSIVLFWLKAVSWSQVKQCLGLKESHVNT